MRKHLLVLAVALVAVLIAMPAFAAVEFKYGGQFRAKAQFGDNIFDGTDTKGYFNNFTELGSAGTRYNSDDNRRFIDQRLRLYFSFIGSPNLKVVTKFEMGDTVWGDGIGRLGASSGGNVGADAVSVEVKNAYIEFNLPVCPTTGIVGIQTLTLLDSWIVDDDFSAAVFVTKLDPFRLTFGYVAGQYGADGGAQMMKYSSSDLNVDSFFVAADYNCAPFKASLVFFWQDAHRSNVSMDPGTLDTPVPSYVGVNTGWFDPGHIENNNLFDVGFNLTYKVDWLLAYVNFVKNFGSVDYYDPGVRNLVNNSVISSSDYTGFMVDAGVTYFCPPYTINIGGFYTSGPEISDNPALNGNGNTLPLRGTSSNDVDRFTYPLATTKYFSEIIGGGVLENGLGWYPVRGYGMGMAGTQAGAHSALGGNAGVDGTMYWSGWGFPSNLWTLTVGGSWQICPGTKLSGSYWYFGTAEDVPVAFQAGATLATLAAGTARYSMASDIGHEFDLYLDQEITDGLTLTLVAAYLAAGDAFCPLPFATTAGVGATDINPANYLTPQAQDSYKFGARLMWNF